MDHKQGYIDYCPLHAAAEQLREALKGLLEAIQLEGEEAHYDTVIKGVVTQAKKVLATSEGKEEGKAS